LRRIKQSGSIIADGRLADVAAAAPVPRRTQARRG
jgi:hypothetical protein